MQIDEFFMSSELCHKDAGLKEGSPASHELQSRLWLARPYPLWNVVDMGFYMGSTRLFV